MARRRTRSGRRRALAGIGTTTILGAGMGYLGVATNLIPIAAVASLFMPGLKPIVLGAVAGTGIRGLTGGAGLGAGMNAGGLVG